MISLLLSLAVLVIGYLLYGRLTERIFSPDDRPTPAIAVNDKDKDLRRAAGVGGVRILTGHRHAERFRAPLPLR